MAASASIGALWSLSGCSSCPATPCPNQAFYLTSMTECITEIDTCTGTIKPPKQSCHGVQILPEGDGGPCAVVATLESGTTLSFTVTFTFKGSSACCGDQWDISPPSITIGGPDAGAIDAGGDATEADASPEAD